MSETSLRREFAAKNGKTAGKRVLTKAKCDTTSGRDDSVLAEVLVASLSQEVKGIPPFLRGFLIFYPHVFACFSVERQSKWGSWLPGTWHARLQQCQRQLQESEPKGSVLEASVFVAPQVQCPLQNRFVASGVECLFCHGSLHLVR